MRCPSTDTDRSELTSSLGVANASRRGAVGGALVVRPSATFPPEVAASSFPAVDFEALVLVCCYAGTVNRDDLGMETASGGSM